MNNWETRLSIDAMYFHAARQAHAHAQNCAKDIEVAEQRWASLNKSYEEILSKYGGDAISAYDKLEPIAIELSNAHDEIGFAYAPLLKEVAVVHILCTATLEAHINSVAKELLQGNDFEHFQNLGIGTKWLFLPKIAGLSGYETERQPFQDFSKLLKFRNKLAHYKGLKEKWVYGSVPQFITDLGLTLGDSQKSIDSVEGMICELSKQRNIKPPYWLRPDLNNMSYFELVTK